MSLKRMSEIHQSTIFFLTKESFNSKLVVDLPSTIFSWRKMIALINRFTSLKIKRFIKDSEAEWEDRSSGKAREGKIFSVTNLMIEWKVLLAEECPVNRKKLNRNSMPKKTLTLPMKITNLHQSKFNQTNSPKPNNSHQSHLSHITCQYLLKCSMTFTVKVSR